jgi:hypothetical protein
MFAELAVESFQRAPQASWLSVGASLVAVFGPVASYTNIPVESFLQRNPGKYTIDHYGVAQQLAEILSELATRMTLLTCNALFGVAELPSVFESETQLQKSAVTAMTSQLDTRPDIADNMFTFLDMCTTRFPAALFGPSTNASRPLEAFVHQLFGVSLAALCMHERLAYKSAVQMLINVIALTKESTSVSVQVRQTVDAAIQSLGYHFVRECVSGIAVSIPRTYLHLVADFLYKLVMRYPDQSRAWLKSALGLPMMPGADVQADLAVVAAAKTPLSARETFLRQLMTTRQIRPFKELVKEFALKCRGLHGTQYAAATN